VGHAEVYENYDRAITRFFHFCSLRMAPGRGPWPVDLLTNPILEARLEPADNLVVVLRLALLCVVAGVMGCGSAPDSPLPSVTANDKLGVPSSPTSDLLNEMTKGQSADLSDPKKNERNARLLPQVIANSNNAISRIEAGEDSAKVVADIQRQNAQIPK
jgi:hypothetical protein